MSARTSKPIRVAGSAAATAPAPAKARSHRRESTGTRLSPTRSLGVFGWSELDEVILAALALEAPVLLVGEHGTAKTMVVERLAGALGLEFRRMPASVCETPRRRTSRRCASAE